MADVFISYKKQDRALAERVEAALRREGHTVWWDDSLTPRESWDAIIQREIAAAAAVVVIWTPRSVVSEWVRIEANYGKQNGKLVPLLAEPCDIPLAFSLTQAAILTDWDGAPGHGEWQKALGWIAALKAETDGPDPLPEASAEAAPPTAPADEGGAQKMWSSIENSLDTRDYADFREHFSESKLAFEARRRIRQLEDWAAVDRDDHGAINAFRKHAGETSPLFAALDKATKRRRDEVRARDLAAERAAGAAPVSDAASPNDDPPYEPPGPRPWARYGLAGLALAVVAGLGAMMVTGRETGPAPAPEPEDTAPTAYQPGDTFRDALASGGEGPEMVVLPQGSFIMGSPESEDGRGDDEGPQRTVRIEYALAAGKYEVTWDQWNACVAGGGCDNAGPASKGGDEGRGMGARPVINVSWNDAQDYVAWLGVQTDETYRLLSEAEWEYAARGVTSPTQAHTRFHWGDDDPVCERGARNGAASGPCRGWTWPVGYFAANAFGLHDMHGNVSEWVEDCYVENYEGAPTDGSARSVSDCSRVVFRGGSYDSFGRTLRSADRDGSNPSGGGTILGFRVARTF